MKRLLLLATLICIVTTSLAQSQQELVQPTQGEKLAILWTNDNPEVAKEVAFIYAYNAARRQWFSEITLIVWGPSAKLLCENEELQEMIHKMADAGVRLQACIACANNYGVSDKLRELGIEVKGMGAPLSEYIKEGYYTLTF